MKSLTEAWLTAAKNDMDVIGRIIADDHLTHIVAFHAQQAVEKCFKALMEEHAVDARKIHSLVTLYAKVEIFLVPHKQKRKKGDATLFLNWFMCRALGDAKG